MESRPFNTWRFPQYKLFTKLTRRDTVGLAKILAGTLTISDYVDSLHDQDGLCGLSIPEAEKTVTIIIEALKYEENDM